MIECRDVWYGYGAEPVLRGVDFTIPAGAAVLLEGESPIAHLFCRLRLQPQGRFYGAVGGAIDTRRVLDRAVPR